MSGGARQVGEENRSRMLDELTDSKTQLARCGRAPPHAARSPPLRQGGCRQGALRF